MAKAEFFVNNKDIVSLADEVDRLKLISKFFDYSTEATKARLRRRFASSLDCGSSTKELLEQKLTVGMVTIGYSSRKIDDTKKIKKAFYDALRSDKNKSLLDSDPLKITRDRFIKTTCDFSLNYANEDVSLMLNRMYRLLSDIKSKNGDLHSYIKNDFIKGRDEEIFIKRKIVSDSLKLMFDEKKDELILALSNEGYDTKSALVSVRVGQFKTKVVEYPEVRSKDFLSFIEQSQGPVGDSFKNESLSIMVSAPRGFKSGLGATYVALKGKYEDFTESLIKDTLGAKSPLVMIPDMDSSTIKTSVQKDVLEVRGRNNADEFEI